MRNPIFQKWLIPLALVTLTALCGCGPKAASPEASNPEAATAQEAPAAAVQEDSPESVAESGSGADAQQAGATNFSDAAFQVMPGEMTLPASIRRTGPVANVIRLATSGVEQGVLMGFVTNSTSLFGLTPDEIIYLNDLGVASGVVEAMLQRDQFLKETASNVATAAPEAPLPSAEITVAQPQPPPVPQEVAADKVLDKVSDNGVAQPAEVPQAGEAPVPPGIAVAQPPPGDAPVTEEPPPPVETVDAGFYDALTPYGTWVDVAGCGPCWQPAVAVLSPGWQPYVDGGRWIYTDCGWYWLSGYSWGWAAFHYGRWFHHNELGWCWSPDTVWAPAWVCWRNNGYYCGWAPLPPGAAFSTTAGMTFHGQPVAPGFNFGLGTNSFVFVHVGHFMDHHLHPFVLPGGQASRLFGETKPAATFASVRGRVTNPGPPPTKVASATRSEIRQVALRDQPTAGANEAHGEKLSLGGRTLGVFRPELAGGPQRTLTLASASMQKSAELTVSRAAEPAGGNVPQDAAPAVPASSGAVVIDQPAAVPRTESAPGPTAYVIRNHGSNPKVNQTSRGQAGMNPPLQPPAYPAWRGAQPEANAPSVQQRPTPEPASRPAEVRPEAPRYVPPPEPPQRHEAPPPPAPASAPAGRSGR